MAMLGNPYEVAGIDIILIFHPTGRTDKAKIPESSIQSRTSRRRLVLPVGNALRRTAKDFN